MEGCEERGMMGVVVSNVKQPGRSVHSGGFSTLLRGDVHFRPTRGQLL